MHALLVAAAACWQGGAAICLARADVAQPTVPQRDTDFQVLPGVREFSGRLLVSAAPGQVEKVAKHLSQWTCERWPVPLDVWSVEVPRGETEASLAARLWEELGSETCAWIRPDWRVFVQVATVLEPNDPDYWRQWHLPTINAPAAWATSTGLKQVTVACVDTGVDLTHLDLMSNLVPGYCSYVTVRSPQSGAGVVQDANGHGTAVAGMVGAVGDNGRQGSGVAWSVSVMPVRATNPQWGTGSAVATDIINGAMWAADHGARVVSISFGGVSEPYVQELGAALRTRRVLLVWPMDNAAINYATSFDHADVLVVGGTDASDQPYVAGSFGRAIDLSAPAVNLYTTQLGGLSWYVTGNSFAAPAVAGAAALVLSVASELAPLQIEQVLRETSADLGPSGRDDRFGWGRLNVGAAVWLAPLRQMAMGPDHPAPAPEVRARYSVEDLYRIAASPADLDGDGASSEADLGVMESLLRFDEATDATRR